MQENSHRMNRSDPTAGIIVIGDEILKGHVQDTNSHFLCKRLFALGVKVKRVSVIPDELDTIANEVSMFSERYTHVITAGGIGPTHDDVTFEGVAKAFGEKVYPNPELVALCKKFFGTDDLANPKLKLAHIPESAELQYGIDKKTKVPHPYPWVKVRNVTVLPGVPKLMERAFDMMDEQFRNPDARFHVREVYINKDEMSITSVLNEVDAKFKEQVIMGSYPDFYNSYYKVKLTFESQEPKNVEDAIAFLRQSLPENSIVSFDKDPIVNAAANLDALLAKKEGDEGYLWQLSHAVSVVEGALEKYSIDELCVGFNGGKDCTVLLHLVYAVLRRKQPNNNIKLKALYIRRGQPFPELEIFIKKCIQRYNLEIITIDGRIKDALGELKTSHPSIKAVMMGTRRTDPYSDHLQSFSATDAGWPEFMRVSPILDWSYADIWGFLRGLNLQYCILYDRGYTSLGSMENTHPNPALQQVDEKKIITYKPAYMLDDGTAEREGRN